MKRLLFLLILFFASNIDSKVLSVNVLKILEGKGVPLCLEVKDFLKDKPYEINKFYQKMVEKIKKVSVSIANNLQKIDMVLLDLGDTGGSFGVMHLIIDPDCDITGQVINELNKEYLNSSTTTRF